MPIYEYKCLECGASLEKIQKISDELLTVCEKCGGKLEKQVSLSGFQFKGAGWYVTDYAGKKADVTTDKKTETKADSQAETKTEKTSTTESTTKPETASKTSKSTESGSKKD
jgi:putative FmdB family regulatory protein